MFFSIPQKTNSILFKLILGLSASVVILLGSIGYSYHVSSLIYQTNTLIERTDSLISHLELLDLKLADCESSIRAFAESNKVSFLYNYSNARMATRRYLESLEKLTESDSLQSLKLQQLQNLIKERYRLLDKAVAIHKGEMKDEEGLTARWEQARRLRNKIDGTIEDIKSILESSLNKRKQQTRKWLSINKRANLVAGVIGGFIALLLAIAIINDVREREKKEKQLQLLNDQKNRFFSIISHDLRGPTRNTALLLEMMDDYRYAPSPEESQKLARLALNSAKQTQKLVEDLLTWGRLQMDQVEIVSSRFRPYEIVEKVCQALQSAALLKNITVENKIPHKLFIQADSNMVETVIRNLVSNAIKFTPKAGKVTVEARQSGRFVELTVEDSGIGMTAETIEKIFSFYTKHTTKGTAGEPGTGLGLAFCREFVERNGGNIHVNSQVGLGSKFNVRLPAAELVEQV